MLVTAGSFFRDSFLRIRVMLNDAFRKRLCSIGFDQKVMLRPRLDTVKKEVSVMCFC